MGARLRADPRLPPLRRTPPDRRPRRLARRSPTSCSGTSRPSPTSSSSARSSHRTAAISSGAADALRALPRDGRCAAALLGRRRTRVVPGTRSAGARGDEPRPAPTRPRAGSSDRSSCTRSTSPPVSTSRPCCCPSPMPIPTPSSSASRRYAHDELTWYLFLGTAFYERGHAEHAEAPAAPLPGDRRRACRSARRAARGPRDAASLRRGRDRGRRSRRGHAAVRRGAAPADARGDAARRSRERRVPR